MESIKPIISESYRQLLELMSVRSCLSQAPDLGFW